jgi:NADH-quinone oxidoreductase subunit J
MTASQIIFILVAAATLGAAAMVVITRNMVHAALWLVVALFGVAVLYAVLNAGFLAVAQVVIYIGAIAILMIFAVMLTLTQLSPRDDSLAQLGQALVSPNAYVIPFEVASVLLLAALIGAIMVAWERK